MSKSTKTPRRRAGSKSRELVPVTPRSTAIAVPEGLTVGDHKIRPDHVLHIPELKPDCPGPWQDEPDRVAWTDAATGYSCLILRQLDGELAGFVGVGPSHPLWSYERDAIPASLGITAHTGIDYAALCDQNGPPEFQICHVHHMAVGQQLASVTVNRDEAGLDLADAWWFGFTCDKVGDFLPGDEAHNDTRREEGPKIYRDIGYVAAEVLTLAGQLKALEDQAGSTDGNSMTDSGVPLLLESKPKALLPRAGGRHE